MDPRRYRGLPAFYRQCSIKCLEEEMKARRKSRAKSRVQFKDPTLRQAVRSTKARDDKHTKQLINHMSIIGMDADCALSQMEKGDWITAVQHIAEVVARAKMIEKMVEDY